MLQSVLDSMTEGLIASDAKGEFLLWNPAARNIIGMDAASVPPNEWSQHYGIFMEDMLTPFPDEQYPLVRAAKGDANTTVMYLQNSKLDAGVWIEVSASPLRDKHGQACGGVAAFRNITQRRLDEQKIRKLNEELEERVIQRTAQLEAINRELEAFTYSVSHDLRAPLRHIAGFSRILVEDFSANLASEAKDHLRRIETGVHRMGLLVDELLNLSRVGRHSVRLQPADLNFIIEEVKALLQSEAADRTVNWKIAILPEVTCDPILIKQVFQNLMANALKFTRPRPQAVIDISHHLKDGQIVIAVSDNGVGFNMKYQDKLFGVFQRLHSAKDFEGTGIGLVTVQRIVHKHGGQVWAESEVDKGATFFFTLPASEPALIKPQPASLPVLATLQESKTAAAGAKA
jgi:signal transduction histidine kinase